MHAVSVSGLKNNPAEALRQSKQGMVVGAQQGPARCGDDGPSIRAACLRHGRAGRAGHCPVPRWWLSLARAPPAVAEWTPPPSSPISRGWGSGDPILTESRKPTRDLDTLEAMAWSRSSVDPAL